MSRAVPLLLAALLALPGALPASGDAATARATLSLSDGYRIAWNLTTGDALALLAEARERLGLDAEPPSEARGDSPGLHAGDVRFDGKGPCVVGFHHGTPLTDPAPRWAPRGVRLQEGGAIDVEAGRGSHVAEGPTLPTGEIPLSWGRHDRFRGVGHGWALEINWRTGEPDCVAAVTGLGVARWSVADGLAPAPPG